MVDNGPTLMRPFLTATSCSPLKTVAPSYVMLSRVCLPLSATDRDVCFMVGDRQAGVLCMVRWKEGLSTARVSSLVDKPASCLLQSLGKVTVDHSPGGLAIVSHRLHDGLSLFYEWLHLPVMKLAASISWLHVNGDLRVHCVEGSR